MSHFSVPGSWGEWSSWSECNNQECGRGLQERKRTCDSPKPVNGGPGCEGTPVQKKACTKVCPPVHGDWTPWTSWSSCSVDCLQFRRRTCTQPTPANGGRYCQGKDILSRNCTGASCLPLVTSNDLPVLFGDHEAGSDQIATSDLTLYIGLAVAFLVFVLVVFIIVRLLQRKRSPHAGYSLTSTGETLTKLAVSAQLIPEISGVIIN